MLKIIYWLGPAVGLLDPFYKCSIKFIYIPRTICEIGQRLTRLVWVAYLYTCCKVERRNICDTCVLLPSRVWGIHRHATPRQATPRHDMVPGVVCCFGICWWRADNGLSMWQILLSNGGHLPIRALEFIASQIRSLDSARRDYSLRDVLYISWTTTYSLLCQS